MARGKTSSPSVPAKPSVSSFSRRKAHNTKALGVHPYFKFRHEIAHPHAAANQAPWAVPDLCVAYNWPSNLEGGGIIAIIELGGGWNADDMDKFFSGLGQPTPSITSISVDGTQNSPDPNNPDSPDGEVALDIQVAGAAYYCATGKPATIKVYYSQDIAAAVRKATADGCDVCSISWGSDEASWLRQDPKSPAAMEAAALAATTAGMVVFAASGDNDSSDGGTTRANVDLPASTPHVIGCGGTMKPHTGDETVWNNNPGQANGEGTGGGFSTIFPMPNWMSGAPHGNRMVPDVAANADPNTGYEIVLNGNAEVVGGTSAVAPLYAGLFAAFGKKLGFVAPELWQNHTCFNDITKGDNGAYRAFVGPDPCTGLGTPIGSKLAALLASSTATSNRQLRAALRENALLRQKIAELAMSPSGGCNSAPRQVLLRPLSQPGYYPGDQVCYDPATNTYHEC